MVQAKGEGRGNRGIRRDIYSPIMAILVLTGLITGMHVGTQSDALSLHA
jgi:hypothetical protein